MYIHTHMYIYIYPTVLAHQAAIVPDGHLQEVSQRVDSFILQGGVQTYLLKHNDQMFMIIKSFMIVFCMTIFFIVMKNIMNIFFMITRMFMIIKLCMVIVFEFLYS